MLKLFSEDKEAFAFLEGLAQPAKEKVFDIMCDVLLEGDFADAPKATTTAPVTASRITTATTVVDHSQQAKDLTRKILRNMTFVPELFFPYLNMGQSTPTVASAAEEKKAAEDSPANEEATSTRKRRRGKAGASPKDAPAKKTRVEEEEEAKETVTLSSHQIRKLTLVLEMLQPRVSAMPRNHLLAPSLFKSLDFFVQEKPETTTADNGECC